MTEQNEPASLLAPARTDGPKVRSHDGHVLGSVHALMIDKRSGQSRYAILSIGGFLGMSKSFYPLPFELVSYDAAEDGYVVTRDRQVLEGGPSRANNAPDFNQAYVDRVASCYGVKAPDIV